MCAGSVSEWIILRVSAHYLNRTIIDSLVGGQEPEDLCVNDNDISLVPCKFLHDNYFQVSIVLLFTLIILMLLRLIMLHLLILFMIIYILLMLISLIMLHLIILFMIIYKKNCVSGLCSLVEDKIMYYCVNHCIHTRFTCNFLAKKWPRA
jgi:hypothetical protein